PLQQVVEEGRRTLAGGVDKAALARAAYRREDHSLYAVLTKAMNPPADSGSAHPETSSATASAAALHGEKAPLVSPTPSVAMNFPAYSPPPASESKSQSGPASAMGQGEKIQGKEAIPASSSRKIVVEGPPSSRPTSLVGWLKSRSSETIVAAPA